MAINAKNNNLQEVKNNKKDEFYTKLSYIESALTYYKKCFKNKVVYGNCDNSRVSNFFHFFSYNFIKACCFFLSLSILLASCQGNQGTTTTATEMSKQRVPPIDGPVKKYRTPLPHPAPPTTNKN